MELCYVYLPIPYNQSSFSRDHQTVTIMNHCCYCFDDLWKVKAKYVALCSNDFAKLQNARGASHHPALMGNCLLAVKCFDPINPLNGLLSLRPRWGVEHEILWPREGCLLRIKLI